VCGVRLLVPLHALSRYVCVQLCRALVAASDAGFARSCACRCVALHAQSLPCAVMGLSRHHVVSSNIASEASLQRVSFRLFMRSTCMHLHVQQCAACRRAVCIMGAIRIRSAHAHIVSVVLCAAAGRTHVAPCARSCLLCPSFAHKKRANRSRRVSRQFMYMYAHENNANRATLQLGPEVTVH
jgi:hypothetical protein